MDKKDLNNIAIRLTYILEKISKVQLSMIDYTKELLVIEDKDIDKFSEEMYQFKHQFNNISDELQKIIYENI